MIGDDIPHAPAQTPQKLNWRKELDKLTELGITVYGIQALNRAHATPFYEELAHKSGGFHLRLDQFLYITDFCQFVISKRLQTNFKITSKKLSKKVE